MLVLNNIFVVDSTFYISSSNHNEKQVCFFKTTYNLVMYSSAPGKSVNIKNIVQYLVAAAVCKGSQWTKNGKKLQK